MHWGQALARAYFIAYTAAAAAASSSVARALGPDFQKILGKT